MRFIKLGKINKKFLIPVLGGTFKLIYSFLIGLNPKYEIITRNPFILSIYINIGMIFAFIPYLILKYRSKKAKYLKERQNESKLNIELIHYDIFLKTRASKFKLIGVSTLFDFFQTVLINVFCSKCVYNLWFFDIIFISIFSYFLLKTNFYRHQYVSMVIILIFGLFLNIIEYFKSDDKTNKLDPFEIAMKFLTEIFFSLSVVIIKYNLEKNYCSPYEICIWEGFLGIILYIIVLVIINKLELTIGDIKYPDNFSEFIEGYDFNDFIVFFSNIITSCIYNISIFLTCDYFTPVHILIISIMKECYYYLKSMKNYILNILGIITLILIAFTFLIFIEIIELSVFKISYNTKNNIEKRSRIDSQVDINDLIDLTDVVKPEPDEEEIRKTTFSNYSESTQ